MRLQDHFEVELKLSITGDDPDELLDEIDALDRIGGFRLGPSAYHRLHDVYWDLPDGSLRSRKLSLRLREIDGDPFFTAKGSGGSVDGVFTRHELELPATPASWEALREVFAGEGIALAAPGAGDAPARWLEEAGLRRTQDRLTRRAARLAYADGAPDRAVAELALDRTRFDFGSIGVDYWEIEVEQLDGAEEAPSAIGRLLLARYPGRVEFSKMGKYSRGLSLERELRAEGRL